MNLDTGPSTSQWNQGQGKCIVKGWLFGMLVGKYLLVCSRGKVSKIMPKLLKLLVKTQIRRKMSPGKIFSETERNQNHSHFYESGTLTSWSTMKQGK